MGSLQAAATRYAQVASALSDWVPDLEEAQSLSVHALNLAEVPYATLNQVFALPPGASLTSSQVQQDIQDHQNAVQRAQSELDAARAVLARAVGLRDTQAAYWAAKINQASNDSLTDHESLRGEITSGFDELVGAVAFRDQIVRRHGASGAGPTARRRGSLPAHLAHARHGRPGLVHRFRGQPAHSGNCRFRPGRRVSRLSPARCLTGDGRRLRGSRLESTAPVQMIMGIEAASRRVDYALPVPGHQGQWLIVTFATSGDGGPEGAFADFLVELFDSIMLTFRWVTDHAAADGA
jgi:hypothetical protein